MKILKVLSIDFDYIMYPCIKLYNRFVSENENATVIWERIEREIEIERHLSYDAKAFQEIARLIFRNRGAEFIPIENHEEIVSVLKERPGYNDMKLDLLNVDWHHDICYHPEDVSAIRDFDECNCSDWIGYLLSRGMLERLRWLKAPNSEMPDGQYGFEEPEVLSIREFDKVENDFDIVFFCISPQWVPYQYRHLYDTICAARGEVDGI